MSTSISIHYEYVDRTEEHEAGDLHVYTDCLDDDQSVHIEVSGSKLEAMEVAAAIDHQRVLIVLSRGAFNRIVRAAVKDRPEIAEESDAP
jgi:hypothetical protein